MPSQPNKCNVIGELTLQRKSL